MRCGINLFLNTKIVRTKIFKYIYTHTINNKISCSGFNILYIKIFLHKFLNTLKYLYLLVKNYLKFLYFKRVILVFLKKFLSF